ncbi:hypothetical protein [Candidatus Magnetobacterium casense]|uniref:hypothetical protein n=1 Tax=Candidatus Magnetobacterium casense TaxID=1455061 RepID=UPI0012DC6EE9|nr:hypothetical protein [Candidatus Magnetobacterium casensis]
MRNVGLSLRLAKLKKSHGHWKDYKTANIALDHGNDDVALSLIETMESTSNSSSNSNISHSSTISSSDSQSSSKKRGWFFKFLVFCSTVCFLIPGADYILSNSSLGAGEKLMGFIVSFIISYYIIYKLLDMWNEILVAIIQITLLLIFLKWLFS